MTGSEFKEWRERLGFTQAQIAEKLEVTEMTVYRWETDKAPISKVVQLAIACIERREPGDD